MVHYNTPQHTATQQRTATHRNAGSLHHTHTPDPEDICKQFPAWHTTTYLNTPQHSNTLQHAIVEGVYTTHKHLTLKIFANSFLHSNSLPFFVNVA